MFGLTWKLMSKTAKKWRSFRLRVCVWIWYVFSFLSDVLVTKFCFLVTFIIKLSKRRTNQNLGVITHKDFSSIYYT